MNTDLIQKINKANKDLLIKDIIEIIEYDFKRLASDENKHFMEKNYKYEKDFILNWFNWQRINILLEDYDKQDGWKKGYVPDNCWSSETLFSIFKKLNWCEQDKIYCDAINSFFTTYTLAIHIYEGESTSLNRNYVVFGKDRNDYISRRKLLRDNKFQDYKTINTYECLQILAKSTHTLGNFTPCFDGKFNSVKGLLSDVKDYLPLMVEKIESCIEKSVCIEVGNIKISVETLKKWKKYLIDNREKFFLEDYYYIQKQNENEDQKMVGIPMFPTQSLVNPIPNEKEIEECIKEMNKRIYNRGLRMVCASICNN